MKTIVKAITMLIYLFAAGCGHVDHVMQSSNCPRNTETWISKNKTVICCDKIKPICWYLDDVHKK